jgi:hypothetical protein
MENEIKLSPKARMRELMRIAESDAMTASEFEELLALYKKLVLA